MANLIIKPSAGGDLVIKSSDDSPSITVGTTGQATFAENATLSGTLAVTGNTTLSGTANALGTVATMVLPTASATAVYPAGHVVQTTGITSLATNSHTELTAPTNPLKLLISV